MPFISIGQATFTAGSYSQNFGTSTVASWTDNFTFAGWYASSWKVTTANSNTFAGTLNITAAAPPNGGAWAVYQCNGGTDMKLGTRPSNGTGSADNPGMDGRNGIGLGLCLQNNGGTAINSLTVSFDWLQLSLSQNVNIANNMFFSYFVSASNLNGSDMPNSVHAYTNVVAGNYVAPNNDPGPGSTNQISGYPCTVGGSQSFCFAVNVPVGSYIMLRWWDPNNSNNDPHIAIDNVAVSAYSDNVCSVILPIELLDFNAKKNNEIVNIDWKTATETNNNFFTVERATDYEGFRAIATVNGSGTSTMMHSYTTIDESPFLGNNYYRLRQTDFNGNSSVGGIIAVSMTELSESFSVEIKKCETGLCFSTIGWNSEIGMKVYDITGRLLYTKKVQPNESGNIPNDEITSGLLIITFVSEGHSSVYRILN